MKEQIKKRVRNNLSKKKIILFGAGDAAKVFYTNNKDRLHILSCVTNYQSEVGEKSFLGELDVNKYNKDEFTEDVYYIVCAPYLFGNIELQLESDGLRMYENYVESGIANAILEDKKICLFYGNCILRDVYNCATQVHAFNNEYASVFTQSFASQSKVINRVLFYAKDICDVYVYTHKILDHGSMYELSRDELPEQCEMIGVSNLVLPIYWPEIIPKIIIHNNLFIHPYNIVRKAGGIFGHLLYRKADENINDMVRKGISTSEIIKRLSDDEFYSKSDVQKNINVGLKSVKIAERGMDIRISDFIEENYINVPLYQNYMHPNKMTIWEYVRRLLEKIGIPCDEINELKELSPMHIHEGGDVPIYPSVIKHAGLRFIGENHKYEVMVGNGIELMTFEEYMEHYIEYTRRAIKICDMF